jgi:hypothetical protein
MKTNTCDSLLQLHVHIKRHLMKDLPESDDAVAQWCKDIFVAKVHTKHVFQSGVFM